MIAYLRGLVDLSGDGKLWQKADGNTGQFDGKIKKCRYKNQQTALCGIDLKWTYIYNGRYKRTTPKECTVDAGGKNPEPLRARRRALVTLFQKEG